MKMTMRDLTGGVTRGVSLKLAVLGLCLASVIAERDSDRVASRLHRQLAGMRRRLPFEPSQSATDAYNEAERQLKAMKAELGMLPRDMTDTQAVAQTTTEDEEYAKMRKLRAQAEALLKSATPEDLPPQRHTTHDVDQEAINYADKYLEELDQLEQKLPGVKAREAEQEPSRSGMPGNKVPTTGPRKQTMWAPDAEQPSSGTRSSTDRLAERLESQVNPFAPLPDTQQQPLIDLGANGKMTWSAEALRRAREAYQQPLIDLGANGKMTWSAEALRRAREVDWRRRKPTGAAPATYTMLEEDELSHSRREEQEEKKGDWKGLAGATSGLCGVSWLTYSMSTWINGGCEVADPTAFWIPFGIGAGLLLIGLVTCLLKRDLINRQHMGIATVLVFQASAISMIAFGGFEQAGNNLIHIDELGGMNVFLLIGVSVFVLTLIGMGVFYACYHKEHPRSQFAMGLGAVLTVLVGGSATTIALSPTLLTGNAMWIGIGVGAFVLVAICAAAFRTCSRYGGSGAEAMNDNKTGALVFVAWSGIIAVTGTGAAMISTSAINGQVVLYNPLFWIGAVLAGVVAVGLLAGRLCCQKKNACRNLFFQ